MSVLAVLSSSGPRLADPEVPLLRADDAGVLRGESVFETLRIAGGRVAFLDAHLERLAASAARLEIPVPEGWPALVDLVARTWDLPDGTLRLVLTRGGVAYALVSEVPAESVRVRREGLHAVTLAWGVPAGLRAEAPWLLGGVKCTSYATHMAATRHAVSLGADDAVLVSSDGEVLEGPTSNVAWVRDGVLVTPPAEVGILPGITIQVVLALCAERGIPTQVRRAASTELAVADEVLLTGSVRGVVPVLTLDGRELGAGPVTTVLRDAFEQRLLA
jgi:4-amino-4-deoxychorismate lyase